MTETEIKNNRQEPDETQFLDKNRQDGYGPVVAARKPVGGSQSAKSGNVKRPLPVRKRKRPPGTMAQPNAVTPDTPFRALSQATRSACANAKVTVFEGELHLSENISIPTLTAEFTRTGNKGQEFMKVAGYLKAPHEKRWQILEDQLKLSPAAAVPWNGLLDRMGQVAAGHTCAPLGPTMMQKSTSVSVSSKVTSGGAGFNAKVWQVELRRGQMVVASAYWLHGMWFRTDADVRAFARAWAELVGRDGTAHLAQLDDIMGQVRVPVVGTTCTDEDTVRAQVQSIVVPPAPVQPTGWLGGMFGGRNVRRRIG